MYCRDCDEVLDVFNTAGLCTDCLINNLWELLASAYKELKAGTNHSRATCVETIRKFYADYGVKK